MTGELLDISRSALRRLAASHGRANSIREGWPFQLHIQENWRIVRRAFIQAIFRVDQAFFKMVRDTGFEPPPASLREALRARCDPYPLTKIISGGANHDFFLAWVSGPDLNIFSVSGVLRAVMEAGVQ